MAPRLGLRENWPQFGLLVLVNASVGGMVGLERTILPRLAEQSADVFCVGTAEAVARAAVGVVLPTEVSEELSPVLEILPFQQLAHHLAVARGSDPDAPRGLRKVTETV